MNKTILHDPEKSLHNYVEEQAEQAKIEYLESWSHNFRRFSLVKNVKLSCC